MPRDRPALAHAANHSSADRALRGLLRAFLRAFLLLWTLHSLQSYQSQFVEETSLVFSAAMEEKYAIEFLSTNCLACDLCRTKKIKCDAVGHQQTPCSMCARCGVQCGFSLQRKAGVKPKRNIDISVDVQDKVDGQGGKEHLLIRSDKNTTGYKGVDPHKGRFQARCDTSP